MQDKIKNNIITYGFVLILIVMFFANIFTKDKTVSLSERRKLATFPEITIDNLLNGNVNSSLEKYTVDQMVLRDNFRSIKAIWNMNIFKQKDNNGLFVKDNAIYKMEYPLNENNVSKSFDKINKVYGKYLENMNVYYTIIPDKNYYLENDDHLKLDYNKVVQIAESKLDNNMKYIDISKSLDLSDYYKTDLHWKQEKLIDVVNVIENNMGLNQTQINDYVLNNEGDFYGTYYSQLGLNILPDTMYTLRNDITESSTTYNYEKNSYGKVYDNKVLVDKYDMYLSGATALISIQNPNAENTKELLLFRDSFGSSIAPLLIQNYSKITLVDLRYISETLLDKYIDFNNQDVLFMYSTLILNQNVLK